MTLVDTNIWFYLFDPSSSFHTAAVSSLSLHPPYCTTSQVLREFLVVATRTQMATVSDALNFVNGIQQQFPVYAETPQTFTHLTQLIAQYEVKGKQIHDCQLIATMRSHGITKILTHNTADFKRFSSFITVIPMI
jgi:predicted nucleic acid-binding protein